MDISYKRELNHSYLVLKSENSQHLSDYPTKMLFSNSIEGLLLCTPRLIDGETFFYYEITSQQNLSQIYEARKFDVKDLKFLFESLLNAITCMEDYLLDADLLLLHPDYIYQSIGASSFCFCCFPLEPASCGKTFLSLTEYLLPKINHEDNRAVLLGYGLYKDSLGSALCKELLKNALAKSEDSSVQNHSFKESVQEEADLDDDSQVIMQPFFEEEAKQERNSIWWLVGILLSLTAFSVCAYFCLHYRLLSTFEAIVSFILFFLLSGTSLLIFFLVSKKRKKKSEPVVDFSSDFSPGFESSVYPTPEPLPASHSSDTVLLQPDVSPAAPSAFLTFVENSQTRTVFLTKEFLLIGKHPDTSDLCLPVPTVSRLHARIRKEGTHFFIMDLNSKNGTSINGQFLSPQEEYQLCDNDRIQVSEVELIFHALQINEQ